MTAADVHEERDIGHNAARQLPLDADIDTVVDAGREILLIPFGWSPPRSVYRP